MFHFIWNQPPGGTPIYGNPHIKRFCEWLQVPASPGQVACQGAFAGHRWQWEQSWTLPTNRVFFSNVDFKVKGCFIKFVRLWISETRQTDIVHTILTHFGHQQKERLGFVSVDHPTLKVEPAAGSAGSWKTRFRTENGQNGQTLRNHNSFLKYPIQEPWISKWTISWLDEVRCLPWVPIISRCTPVTPIPSNHGEFPAISPV